MFGTYRFALAVMVVFGHLGGNFFNFEGNYSGGYAVASFYMLSGYLMTLVLNKNYGFTAGGLKRYFANRALRIYPAYLTVALMAVGLIIFFDPDIRHARMILPDTLLGWFSNLTIIGLDTNDRALLVPPAWSLYVELIFYVAMALFFARSKTITLAWFIVSLAYALYLAAIGAGWSERYFPPQAASLIFSIGAMFYHYKPSIRPSTGLTLAASALFFGNLVLWHYIGSGVDFWGYYIQIIAAALMLFCLKDIQTRACSVWFARLDSVLGGMSYPIFLCHYHAAALTTLVFLNGPFKRGKLLFFASLPIIMIISFIIYALLDLKIDAARARIRGGRSAGKEAS